MGMVDEKGVTVRMEGRCQWVGRDQWVVEKAGRGEM